MAGKGGRPMGRRHQDDIRAKIQAAHIVRRFHEAFNGNLTLTAEQINIGKSLLNKTLPDLKAIEHTGEGGGPVLYEKIRREIVRPDDKNA